MTEQVTVLHVDDEPAFAELQRTYLENIFETDLSLEVITDPTATRAFLEENAVDCVVCDYDMPEMNGLKLLQSVRHSYPNLPFVLLTSRGNEDVASEAIQHGVTDYVPKPSGSKEYRVLANRIRNAVTQHRQRRRAQSDADGLEAALDRMTEPFVVLDDEYRYRYANAAAKRFLGDSDGAGNDGGDHGDDEDSGDRGHGEDSGDGSTAGTGAGSLLATPVWETLPGGGDGALEAGLREAMTERTRVVVNGEETSFESLSEARFYPGADGLTGLFRLSAEPVDD